MHCKIVENTIDSCINSATDRRGYVLECRFTKFSKITQCNDHYAVQGHSRLPILVPIESSVKLRCGCGYYAVQGHQVWYQSKAYMRLPISD